MLATLVSLAEQIVSICVCCVPPIKAFTIPDRNRRPNVADMPHELDRSELRVALQFCAVLEPFRLATKLLEGDDQAPASLYLPVFHKCVETLPSDAWPGLQSSRVGGATKALASLLAPRLEQSQREALSRNYWRGMASCSSYVDPRFRGHTMWEKLNKKEVKDMICKWLWNHTKSAQNFGKD